MHARHCTSGNKEFLMFPVCLCVLKAAICLNCTPLHCETDWPCKSKAGVTLIDLLWFLHLYVQYGFTICRMEKTFLHPSEDSLRFKKQHVFYDYLCFWWWSHQSGSRLEEHYFQMIPSLYSTLAAWHSTVKTIHFCLMKNRAQNKQVETQRNLQSKLRKEIRKAKQIGENLLEIEKY